MLATLIKNAWIGIAKIMNVSDERSEKFSTVLVAMTN
jgi:hypothetical protein